MRNSFTLLVATIGFLCAGTALAQTKVTGVETCAKADPQHMIAASDSADHSFGVGQAKCTWTKPMDMGGDKGKTGLNTEVLEVSGTKVSAHGAHMSTMESGDKIFVSYKYTGTMKGGALDASKGTWTYTGATGKFKGIKGGGTFTCGPAPAGGSTCDVAGEYQLPK